MKTTNSFSLFFILLLSSFLLSCTSKECEINYSLICSEDVLEYLQPSVTYIDGNNQIREVILEKDDFRDFDGTFEISRNSVWDGIKKWEIKTIHKDDDFEAYMNVEFKRIKEVPDEERDYKYISNLTVSGVYKEKGLSSVKAESNVGIDSSLLNIDILSTESFNYRLSQLEKYGLNKRIVVDKGSITIK